MSEDSLPGDELTRTIRQYEMRMAYLNQNLGVWKNRYTDLLTKVQACCRLAGLPPVEGEPDPSRLTEEILRLRRLTESN